MSDKSKLTNFVSKEGGYVTFGDNNKGKIMGEENIGNQYKTHKKCPTCKWTKAQPLEH